MILAHNSAELCIQVSWKRSAIHFNSKATYFCDAASEVFQQEGKWFQWAGKLSLLNFFTRITFTSLSNQTSKITLIATQFACCPALNDTPVVCWNNLLALLLPVSIGRWNFAGSTISLHRFHISIVNELLQWANKYQCELHQIVRSFPIMFWGVRNATLSDFRCDIPLLEVTHPSYLTAKSKLPSCMSSVHQNRCHAPLRNL